MNRRDLLLATVGLPLISFGKTPKRPASWPPSRMEMYKKYEEALAIHPTAAQTIDRIVDNAHEKLVFDDPFPFPFEFYYRTEEVWTWLKELAIYGDLFLEKLPLPGPGFRCKKILQQLSCKTMYRIETITAKLVEFQQSQTGPCYQSLVRWHAPSTQAKPGIIRFRPEEIIHIRLHRPGFYPSYKPGEVIHTVKCPPPNLPKHFPYGTSLLKIDEDTYPARLVICSHNAEHALAQTLRHAFSKEGRI